MGKRILLPAVHHTFLSACKENVIQNTTTTIVVSFVAELECVAQLCTNCLQEFMLNCFSQHFQTHNYVLHANLQAARIPPLSCN
jgi:hypothetical protein